MKTLFLKLVLLIFVLLFSSIFVFSQIQKNLSSVNLKDIKGNTINVSDYLKNNQFVIFSFWATWCKPCIKELSSMTELYEQWAPKYNVKLVAISIDDSRTSMRVPSVVNSKGWKYEVLLDTNEEFKRSMGVSSAPHTFLVNKEGKIIYEHEGYIEGDEFVLEEQIQKETEKK